MNVCTHQVPASQCQRLGEVTLSFWTLTRDLSVSYKSCISFPLINTIPPCCSFQGSHFSSGDRCDPVPVGGNSGEDCWRSGMAVTAAPAHDTYQLVLPVTDTLQWSSGISLQPAEREVLPAAWFHGWHQPQLQRVTKWSGSHSLLSEGFKHQNIND